MVRPTVALGGARLIRNTTVVRGEIALSLRRVLRDKCLDVVLQLRGIVLV